MDSDKYPIQKYIYDWLLDNETIIVPELGQFVAEFKGATIQQSINSLSPPNKTVIFNLEPREDDGILAEFISERESIPKEDVQNYIKQVVTELKIALASDQKYELSAFGTFSKNPIGEIEFTADDTVNFEGESFGLPKLFHKPIEKKEDINFFDQAIDNDEESSMSSTSVEMDFDPEREPEKEEEEANVFVASVAEEKTNKPIADDDDDDDDEFDDDDDDEPIKRKWLVPVMVILAAGVLVTAGIMYGPSLFGGGSKTAKKTDTTKTIAANHGKEDTNTTTSTEVNLADSNKAGTTTDKKDETTTNTTDTDKKNENTNTGTVAANNTGNTRSTPTVTPPTRTYTPPATGGGSNMLKSFRYRPQAPSDLSTALVSAPTSQYYIVVGSFGKRENAYSIYNNLKDRGYTARIIPPNGSDAVHRVTSGTYSSEAEANQDLVKHKKLFGRGAWVKKY